MIFTDRTIIVQKGTSSINDTIVLYRGDRGVEIRFTLNEGSPFKFGSGASPNIIEKTEAAYGQLVIKTPNDLPNIFSEVVPTNEGKIVFTITAEMIDEITEVGNYAFQIRLLDENKGSRVTMPEVVDGIEIREPIASEDAINEVGIATVGYALTSAGTTEDTFDSQGNYNKTTWRTSDRITANKLNKIEDGIEGVNQNVANVKEDLSSQIKDIINNPSIPDNIVLWEDDGFVDEETEQYTLPVATPTTLGGVKPVVKTDEMTQDVGIDSTGKLYTTPATSSSSSTSGSNVFSLLQSVIISDDTTNNVSIECSNISEIIVSFTIAEGTVVQIQLKVNDSIVFYSNSMVDETQKTYGVIEGTYLGDSWLINIAHNNNNNSTGMLSTFNGVQCPQTGTIANKIAVAAKSGHIPNGSIIKIYGR